MSKSRTNGPQPAKIKDVMFSSGEVCFVFKTGQRIVLPIDHEKLATLESADFHVRSNFELISGGEIIAWPALEVTLTANEIIDAAE